MNHYFARALAAQRMAELRHSAERARLARVHTPARPPAEPRRRGTLAALLRGARAAGQG